ncbi:MAG: pilus assembly protein PilM [Kiritimatiellia bacterium]
MAKDIITGMAVSGGELQWTVFSRDRGSLNTVSTGRADLPAGNLRDLEGTGAEELKGAGESIKSQWRRKSGSVVLSVPTDQVLLRVLDLPAAEDEELPGMAELQVDKFSPFPVENMVVSHEVLSEGGGTRPVLIAALRRKALAALGNVLAAAGIVPVRVDAELMGRLHFLRESGELKNQGRQVVLIAGDHAVETAVLDGGIPVILSSFTREADMETEQLAKEAEGELTRSLMSVELKFGAADTCTVYARSGDELKGALSARVSEALSCEVDLKPMEDFPSPSESVVRRHTASSRLLDLGPGEWSRERVSRAFKRRLMTWAAAAAGVWLAGVGLFAGGLQYRKFQVQGLQKKSEKWKKEAMDVRKKRARVNAIRAYMDWRHSALECLREISRALPPGVELSSYSYTKGENVKISGQSSDVDSVYTFKSGLDDSEIFLVSRLHGPRWSRSIRKHIFDVEMTLPEGSQ